MGFLFFIVSLIFSFVFYFFYISSNWKEFLFFKPSWDFFLSWLTNNLVIESIFFIIIWVLFFIYFSWISFKKKKTTKQHVEKNNNKHYSLTKHFKNNKKTFIRMFLVFFIVLSVSLFSYFYLTENYILYIFYFSFLLSFITYFYLTRFKYFLNHIIKLRIISIFFSYLSALFWIIFLLSFWSDIFIVIGLSFLWLFNLYIHNCFENYVSFFSWILVFNFLIYYLYYTLLSEIDDWIIFLTLSLFASLESIIITYFYKFKYKTDYKFFYIFSFFINISSLILYLILFKIDLFSLAIIFFVELIYIYLSYYKLKKISSI